jgi:hypothetical protein
MSDETTPAEPAEGQVPAGDFEPVVDEVVEIKNESGKSNEEVAREVLAGHWGRGQDRRQRLEDNGYNPDEIWDEVTNLREGTREEDS